MIPNKHLQGYCGDVRSRTSYNSFFACNSLFDKIVVTSDLGRVTTISISLRVLWHYCGDVRSRTSYNKNLPWFSVCLIIVVTSDLGRVTTIGLLLLLKQKGIVVTSDLGRVTTRVIEYSVHIPIDCGDVRSRTSYNIVSLSFIKLKLIVVTSDLGRVTTLEFH